MSYIDKEYAKTWWCVREVQHLLGLNWNNKQVHELLDDAEDRVRAVMEQAGLAEIQRIINTDYAQRVQFDQLSTYRQCRGLPAQAKNIVSFKKI